MATRREFLKQGAAVGATAVLGRSAAALEKPAELLQEFAYGDVSLAPGKMQDQFEQTQSVLMGISDDSMLRPWRQRAGQLAVGTPLGGWYDEGGFAPGETTGQWISALARGYAATGSQEKKFRLARLLEKYSGTISGKFYTNFRFPAYDYDKMVIGLIDAYQFAGMNEAFPLLDRTTDAALPHLPPRALDRPEQKAWRASVGDNTTEDYCWDESYTMPENLYLAAARGAGQRYKEMAPKYLLNERYFDPLSENRNVLPGHHAYSFCNALSSAMQAYISDGSEKHLRAAVNAHEMIVSTQSYATGGWGPDESFREPHTGALYESLTKTTHSFETPCGSYAHFKLTRYLLRVTRDGKYGDSMERVLYNTVMGAKPLQPDGRSFYYADFSNSGSKFYHQDKWPCCSGTLPQVAADYHILGYFRDAEGVYVNLYIPSTLRWIGQSGTQLELTQSHTYPLEGRIEMMVRAKKAEPFTLRLRIPGWAGPEAVSSIKVNGQPVQAQVVKGFAAIARKWKDGDRVELDLPLPVRLEPIDELHPETVALVRGPLVLFGLTEDPGKVTRQALLTAQHVKGQALWQTGSQNGPLLLVPFTEIHEEKYRTYFRV
jgi:DUF1680 family protein